MAISDQLAQFRHALEILENPSVYGEEAIQWASQRRIVGVPDLYANEPFDESDYDPVNGFGEMIFEVEQARVIPVIRDSKGEFPYMLGMTTRGHIDYLTVDVGAFREEVPSGSKVIFRLGPPTEVTVSTKVVNGERVYGMEVAMTIDQFRAVAYATADILTAPWEEKSDRKSPPDEKLIIIAKKFVRKAAKGDGIQSFIATDVEVIIESRRKQMDGSIETRQISVDRPVGPD